ncbi:MAG: glutamine synthetase type III [Myxococcales bacterium]|nr:glutamine synthetase type III [Myxococcales bacterium]
MSDASARRLALVTATSRPPRTIARQLDADGRPQRVSQTFGARVFHGERMKQRLPPEIFARWSETVERGSRLDRPVADAIAHAVKEWALENGASHFCHWFHPMTGSTAEKHDSFLWFDSAGRPVEKFTGAMLLQSEPDASSFPSGGMRSTFEARGYTAWDPTSPMFLMDGPSGRTLVIPSAFLGYHGESLDEKAPLLRSMESLGRSASKLCGLLGGAVGRITPTVGPEQEYFVIDKAWAALRPDLTVAGRTVLGASAPKGQSLEDHYFGSIPPRVLAFMEEMEEELYALGVWAKTRHNEVAPGQFELAPIFTEANVAADHNQLVMQTMRKVADRHGLAMLMHEKPFAGVNGSGKHVNWSMQTSTGDNLLEPGQNPQENLRFLAFMAATVLGVHRHAAVLRAAIASHGNDFRLGANEAPPAIISVFLGDFLTRIVDGIVDGSVANLPAGQAMIELGVNRLPAIAKDNTDRNRTSPFAFTGNKFEFRAVGSSASISFPTACLNAAVTDGIDEIVAMMEGGVDVMTAVRKALTESAPVRFDGNGYAAEWVVEAERRGLPHARNTPDALAFLNTNAARALFERTHVLSHEELHSRYDVRLELYNKKVEIEGDVLREMVDTYVVPSVLAEVQAINGVPGSLAQARLTAVQDAADRILARRTELDSAMAGVPDAGAAEVAAYLCGTVVPAHHALRRACDAAERLVADHRWALPKYREMLFVNG